MAKKPLCPLIMKGYPIIFLELRVSCFLVLGYKTLLAGTVSFEGALLSHLPFRVVYLTFRHPHYLCPRSRKAWKLLYSFLFLLLLLEQSGANTEHTVTPSHKGATCIMQMSPWAASFNHRRQCASSYMSPWTAFSASLNHSLG